MAFRWVNWLTSKSNPTSRNRRQRQRDAFRPQLVQLEDRWVPSQTFTVITVADFDNAVTTSNSDAVAHLTSPQNPDIIQYAAGAPVLDSSLPSNTGNLSIAGDLHLGAWVGLNNYGTLSVTGNIIGDDGSHSVNYGTATLSVTHDFTLGNDGFVYNGFSSSDAATLTVGGKFSIGNTSAGSYDSGFVYNFGKSTINVAGDFTIYGDGGSYVFNVGSSAGAAMLTVGGNFSLGLDGFVYNQGASTLCVTGDFTLGNGGYLYNGANNTDDSTLTIGGSFAIGNTSAGSNDSGFVYNYGNSTISVTDNFTIYGGAGSFVYNGAFSSTSTAAFSVGGNFTLGDSTPGPFDYGFVYNFGLSAFAVGGSFTIEGDGGSFLYNGTDSSQTATLNVGGSLSLGENSNIDDFGIIYPPAITLDGLLTVEAGAKLVVDSLVVEPGGEADVFGTLQAPSAAALSGNIITESGGQIVFPHAQTTPTVNAPAESTTYTGVPQGFPSADVTVTGANGLNSSDGTLSITYNGSSTVPTAAGVYTVIVTFMPFDTNDYTNGTTTTTWTISTATVTMHASNESSTYNGSAQAYPLSSGDVYVTGVSSGTDQTPSGSFTYSYYSSTTSPIYGPISTAPTHAGTYTVTVTFNTSDTNYNTGTTGTATFTINTATPVITWNTPGPIAYYMALGANQLNATASVTGAGGSGFTYAPPAGTLLTAGSHTLSTTFTPADSTDYTTATATTQIVVLGTGVTVVGSQLYFVDGSTSNDQVRVSPNGSNNTGSTGVIVNARLNGATTLATYTQSFVGINIFLQGGNDTVQMTSSLTINVVVTAGNGNDIIQLGNGTNTVTLGNGNDIIQAGEGTNTVIAGSGNDNVQLGNGSYNSVTLGAGNDNVQIGNGSHEAVVLGNGNDNVQIGNGSYDDITVGIGHDNFQVGNGSDNTVFVPLNNNHANIKFGVGSNNKTIKN
ncbi:MAG TPA: hypothetical protein VGP68_09460 [Gemmataceae bacterium]|jgi:hypothetical protein|nr:hypothetical protein [Gemmataceae bacterium]